MRDEFHLWFMASRIDRKSKRYLTAEMLAVKSQDHRVVSRWSEYGFAARCEARLAAPFLSLPFKKLPSVVTCWLWSDRQDLAITVGLQRSNYSGQWSSGPKDALSLSEGSSRWLLIELGASLRDATALCGGVSRCASYLLDLLSQRDTPWHRAVASSRTGLFYSSHRELPPQVASRNSHPNSISSHRELPPRQAVALV